MILELFRDWRRRRLERDAAAWVIRRDEDGAQAEPALRDWIAGDPGRAEAYARAYQALHGASAAARQLYGRQAERQVEERARARPRAGRALILVTTCSLVLAPIALLVMLQHLGHLADRAAPGSATTRTFATKVGEVRDIQLADGSKLTLDTDTLVHVAFSPSAREVRLEHGRVRFTVVHDPNRLFSVAARGATITDRGTVFDVEAYRLVSVRLISGALDIQLPAAVGHGPTAMHLAVGHQLRFDPTATTAMAPTTVPTAPGEVQWVTGLKTFDDVAVSDILEEVNRYASTKISLEDPAIGDRHVFLDLNLRDPQAVARNLALYLGLRAETSQNQTLICARCAR